jgi:hypothetical protein
MAAAIAALIGAAAAAAGTVGSLTRQNPKVQADTLGEQQLQLARNNAQNQALVQALVNQRAVAGSEDAFGGTTHYDPATNTWVSDLGALPKAADTAAMQAGITRNTTDVQNQELANREALRRAAQAGPAADTAQRELAQFRPMQSDQLAGLLQEKSTTAANETFRPLIADTLRSMARTGTAAGPVMAQLGRTQNDELRKSLIDSQIGAMTSTDQINQSRRSGLESAANNANALATPNLQLGGLNPSGNNQAMQSALAYRAANAGNTTAQGMAGANKAIDSLQGATAGAISNLPDPNFNISRTSSAFDQLGSMLGKGGALGPDSAALKSIGSWFGPSTNKGDTGPIINPWADSASG